uniref:ABC transporter domain-containing protein n=1 Tax=Alexandrium andersonii TaxID=327968 RepID=A0A7S2FRQ3_9DINO
MVLDEPTNHLDLYSIDALTDALKAFQGAVILATHNRSMLESLCGHVVLLREGSLQTVSLQDDESLEQWFLRAAARQGASAAPRAGRGKQEAPDVPQAQGSATASAQASATDVVAGAAKAGRLPLVAVGSPGPARAAAAVDTPALRETEKEFLRCVKRVRETLKLEALRASGHLQKTQEEKLQRKAEAWRELSDAEAYLPQDSSLRAKNMDLLASLASEV